MYANVSGYKGVVFNVGWLTNPVLDWRGDLSDTIPIVAGLKQAPWFLIEGNLKGSVADKYAGL